jgi:putative alpha-1,2-mannosidase
MIMVHMFAKVPWVASSYLVLLVSTLLQVCDRHGILEVVLIPVRAGTSVYLLSTPLFPSIAFTDTDPASAGRQTRITTVNFDGAKQNKYIQSAKLNGQPFTRNWFAHDELFGVGGTLELTLGPTPGTWGSGVADLPPSLSTGGKFAGML